MTTLQLEMLRALLVFPLHSALGCCPPWVWGLWARLTDAVKGQLLQAEQGTAIAVYLVHVITFFPQFSAGKKQSAGKVASPRWSVQPHWRTPKPQYLVQQLCVPTPKIHLPSLKGASWLPPFHHSWFTGSPSQFPAAHVDTTCCPLMRIWATSSIAGGAVAQQVGKKRSGVSETLCIKSGRARLWAQHGKDKA